jgi:glycosidase
MRYALTVASIVCVACGIACTRTQAVALDGPVGTGDGPRGDAGVAPPGDWLGQVIYLVMPDRFANGDPTNDNATGCYAPTNPAQIHGGDFAGLRAKIPYLKELGVTAVWITPVYQQVNNCRAYHGYWPDYVDPDDGGIAPNLGDAAALTALIADLHAAGMRLVLDMVVNHSGKSSRISAQHPDWFHDPTTCGSLGASEIYCPLSGLPDFAQEKPEVAAYLSQASARWATRFAIDGVRMDTAKNVLPSYWASSWFPAMRAAAPALFVVGEYFDESGAPALAPLLGDGFDSLFDYPRYGAFVATFAQGGSIDAVANAATQSIATYGLPRALAMTSFVDNHDNQRLTSGVAGSTGEADVVARFRLAQGASFTLPGIPQLMWGDEVAMLGGVSPDNRRDMPAWAWSAATRAGAHPGDSVGDGQQMFAYVQSLIAMRAAHPALQRGSYGELWRQNGGAANVLAFFRGAGADRVIVAINAGGAASVKLHVATAPDLSATDRAAMPDGTMLRELLAAGAPPIAMVAGGVVALDLPAQTIGVYAVGP